MIGNAEYLLNEHNPPAPLARWLDVIDGDFGTVRHFHFGHLTHHFFISFVIPAKAGIHHLTSQHKARFVFVDSSGDGFPLSRE